MHLSTHGECCHLWVLDIERPVNPKCSTVGTKFVKKWSDKICNMALDAVQTVYTDDGGHVEIDIKRYAKIEKVWAGTVRYWGWGQRKPTGRADRLLTCYVGVCTSDIIT